MFISTPMNVHPAPLKWATCSRRLRSAGCDQPAFAGLTRRGKKGDAVAPFPIPEATDSSEPQRRYSPPKVAYIRQPYSGAVTHMIGLIPNVFSVFSAITSLYPRTQAVDIDQCPAPRDIQSKPYTDPDLPPPYGEGYQYTANANNKTWTGQTAATRDDYLGPEYELKAEEINEQNGNLHCDYGGKRLIKNGALAAPYLRLTTVK